MRYIGGMGMVLTAKISGCINKPQPQWRGAERDNMNSVALIGRLTADATVRVTKTNKGKDELAIANFTLAVNRAGSEEADFIRCTAFGKTAEFAEQYLGKGIRIGVTGRIQTGSYEKEDGGTVYTTDVIVERIDFADAPKDDNNKRSSRSRRK